MDNIAKRKDEGSSTPASNVTTIRMIRRRLQNFRGSRLSQERYEIPAGVIRPGTE